MGLQKCHASNGKETGCFLDVLQPSCSTLPQAIRVNSFASSSKVNMVSEFMTNVVLSTDAC